MWPRWHLCQSQEVYQDVNSNSQISCSQSNLPLLLRSWVWRDKNSWWLGSADKNPEWEVRNVHRWSYRVMNETKTKTFLCVRAPTLKQLCSIHHRGCNEGEWGNRKGPTTRIDHTEVLPGSWKAWVPKGLVADGNSTLLFAVTGLGDQVYGLMVQTLCRERVNCKKSYWIRNID